MAVGRSRQPCHMVSHSGKTVDCNNFLFQLIDTIVIKYSSSSDRIFLLLLRRRNGRVVDRGSLENC